MNSACFAIGYHAMNWSSAQNGVHHYKVIRIYSEPHGMIKTRHFPKRDNYSHAFSCLEVSARFDGGMSSGPVIDRSGNVIGVVCFSLGNPDNEGFISYASLIGALLLIQVETQLHSNSLQPKFLYDSALGGYVLSDQSLNTIDIERSVDAISIDFKYPEIFINKIAL